MTRLCVFPVALPGGVFFSAAQIGALKKKRSWFNPNPNPNPKLFHRLNTHLIPICAAEKNNATRGQSGIIRLRTTRPQHSRACNVRETEPWGELRSVSWTPARADPVNQVHSFTCSCPKEDVDGINQYLPWYTPFNPYLLGGGEPPPPPPSTFSEIAPQPLEFLIVVSWLFSLKSYVHFWYHFRRNICL